jgi:purine-nucleoside phosphorylase
MDDDPIALCLRRIAQTAEHRRPEVAVLLGSGWNAMAEQVQEPLRIAYSELPGFPRVGVDGHAGSLLLGRLGGSSGGREVALLCGRQHAYETGRADAMKGAIRTLAQLGCKALVLTNAAGSLDAAMRPGELMLINDHLNLPQQSPLVGEPGSAKFVDMGNAYDPALRATALLAAARAGITLHEGVYAWMLGPQFETPAEIRMLQTLGAHAVGMSTVPETILARHAGLRVLAVSLLTNMGCGLQAETLSHALTLSAAQEAAGRAAGFLAGLVAALEL